ncbi:hypothetical protein ACSQ67_001101 [Phaseolus vulgaris]
MQCSLLTMQVLLQLSFFWIRLLIYLCHTYLIVTSHTSFKPKPEKKMGLSLQKLAPGADQKKLKELEPIIDEGYKELFQDKGSMEFPVFYRAVCEIVEYLTIFKRENEKSKTGKNKALTKTEFQEIMKNLVKTSGFTGIGAKEAILCIFGVPLAALLIKQKVMPEAIRDEYFIPGVTSATVFTLAALNKI